MSFLPGFTEAVDAEIGVEGVGSLILSYAIEESARYERPLPDDLFARCIRSAVERLNGEVAERGTEEV